MHECPRGRPLQQGRGPSGEPATCGECHLGVRWRSGPVPAGTTLAWVGWALGPTRAPGAGPPAGPRGRRGHGCSPPPFALCGGSVLPRPFLRTGADGACRLQGAERRQAEPRVPAAVRAVGKLRGSGPGEERGPRVGVHPEPATLTREEMGPGGRGRLKTQAAAGEGQA